jgi:aryl sulfotransferase
MEVAPWIDARFEPIDVILDRLDAQTFRRHIKTHTPADGIPGWDDASYIVVGRDGRDACMSFLNHMRNMQPALLGELLTTAIDEGIAMDGPPPPVDDQHEFFSWYIEGGFQLEHIASWWKHHGEPNVLYVHYDDMKADLDGQMRRVAAFLDIPVEEDRWPDHVAACTFAGMKARAPEIAPFEEHFVGGADTFLYKGTNGRWRDVLTVDELARYDVAVAKWLTPECATWLAGRTEAASPA